MKFLWFHPPPHIMILIIQVAIRCNVKELSPFFCWVSLTSTPSWVYHCPSFLSYLTGSGVGVWGSTFNRSVEWKLFVGLLSLRFWIVTNPGLKLKTPVWDNNSDLYDHQSPSMLWPLFHNQTLKKKKKPNSITSCGKCNWLRITIILHHWKFKP